MTGAARHVGRHEVFAQYRVPLLRFFKRRVGPSDDRRRSGPRRLSAVLQRRIGIDREHPGLSFPSCRQVIRDKARRAGVRNMMTARRELRYRGRGRLSPERILQSMEAPSDDDRGNLRTSGTGSIVFSHYHFDGVEQVKIARRMGLSLSTVEKHMAKANAHLLYRLAESAMSWLAKTRTRRQRHGTRSCAGPRTSFRNHLHSSMVATGSEHQRAHDRLQAAIRMMRMNADLPELSACSTRHATASRRASGGAGHPVFAVDAALAIVFLLAIATPRPDLVPRSSRGLHGEQLYATTRDERTRIELADGSVVARCRYPHRGAAALSGARSSPVDARCSRSPRIHGARVVVVRCERTITATGTLFDVSLSPRALRVTLAEGSVAVKPLASGRGTPPQILKPQQQLVAFAGATKPTLRTVDVDNALGWADRQIFFEDEPLASAIDEMNRYAGSKIVIDPSVADLRINGMFRMSNQNGFVDALKIALPVDVRRDSQVGARLPPCRQRRIGHVAQDGDERRAGRPVAACFETMIGERRRCERP